MGAAALSKAGGGEAGRVAGGGGVKGAGASGWRWRHEWEAGEAANAAGDERRTRERLATEDVRGETKRAGGRGVSLVR